MFKLHEICSVDSQKKIIKIVATRCQILRLKCTKFDFVWGPPQTPLGELTALPQSPELDLREGEGKMGGDERVGEGGEWIGERRPFW